ncbi:MAG: hypothetical protein GWN53_01290 [Gammaproteobacteria bacterium]|nr:hypothetical protein [Gammaproteobacteria bacterium]
MPALLLALHASGGQAQTFGRLFSTPDVRAALDQLRQDQDYGAAVSTQEPRAHRTTPAPDVTVNGVVLRSGGPDASWINGTIITSGGVTSEGVRVETEDVGEASVRILLPGSERSVRLKPGQKIDVVGGRVLDAYESEASRGEDIDFGTDRPEVDGVSERATAGSVE